MGFLHLGPTLKGLLSGLKDKMNSEEAAVLRVYSHNSGAPVEVGRKKPHSCGTSKAEPRLKEGQYQVPVMTSARGHQWQRVLTPGWGRLDEAGFTALMSGWGASLQAGTAPGRLWAELTGSSQKTKQGPHRESDGIQRHWGFLRLQEAHIVQRS